MDAFAGAWVLAGADGVSGWWGGDRLGSVEIGDGLLGVAERDQEIDVAERGKQIFALAVNFDGQRFDRGAVAMP